MSARRLFWILVLGGAFLAGKSQSQADIYMVVPSPRPVPLQIGERMMGIKAAVSQTFPPQHIYLQFALLGSPVVVQPSDHSAFRRFAPIVEDCPSYLVPKPIAPVTASDLKAARRLLMDFGFSNDDIVTNLVDLPAASCGPVHSASAVVGEILLAVEPNTEAQFDQIVTRISTVVAHIPMLRRANLIERRDTCDAEQAVQLSAERLAQDQAEMLASSTGFILHARQRADFAPDSSRGSIEQICGSGQPVLYPENRAFPTPAPPYFLSLSGGALYSAEDSLRKASRSQVRFVQTASVPDVPDWSQGLVPYAFRMPPQEPFVSAQGSFSGLLRPDALLLVFSIAPNPMKAPPPDLGEKIVDAARRSGVAIGNIRRHKNFISVRIRPVSEAFAAQVVFRVAAAEAAIGVHTTGNGFDVFIKDCRAAELTVARRAFLAALARARIMASATHLGVGALIAVDDAGQNNDAICGYGADASMDELDVRGSARANVHSSGPYASFASSVAVAWQLRTSAVASTDGSPPPFAEPYATTNVNQAYVAPGTGVVGTAAVGLRPAEAFLSLPPAQPVTNLIRSYAAGEASRTNWLGERLIRLRFVDGPAIARVISRFHAAGVEPQNLLIHLGNCEAAQSEALKEAVRNGLFLTNGGRVFALVDQAPIIQRGDNPNWSDRDDELCGFTAFGGGGYAGGSYDWFQHVPYLVRQKILIMAGK